MPYYVVELHITRYFSVDCVQVQKWRGGGRGEGEKLEREKGKGGSPNLSP